MLRGNRTEHNVGKHSEALLAGYFDNTVKRLTSYCLVAPLRCSEGYCCFVRVHQGKNDDMTLLESRRLSPVYQRQSIIRSVNTQHVNYKYEL